MSTAPSPLGKCPLCARAIAVGHACTYFVCQGYQKNGIPDGDADAALKLKADRSTRGEYTLSHVGRWFGEWLILAAVSFDRNGPIFKAVRRVHPRRLEVRADPNTLRVFTSEIWREVAHLAEEQVPWRFPSVVTWDATGEVGGQGWASHPWLGSYALLSERLLPGRPLVDLEPSIARAVMTALLDGLASLHGAGIAHGAVRPDQLAFHERGAQVDAVLLGPAELPFYVPAVQALGGADAGLAWVAPERFADDDMDDDGPEPLQGDVYSAALVVAELVTGKRPFALPTLHVRRQKRDPSADPLASSRALLPAALLAVLDAATCFDPAARIPDAMALQSALRPVLPSLTRGQSRAAPRTAAADSRTPPTAPVNPEAATPEAREPASRARAATVPAATESPTVAPMSTPTTDAPDPRLEAALSRAASAEAATRAVREAYAESEQAWAGRMAGVTSRLRDAEAALAAAEARATMTPSPPVEPPLPAPPPAASEPALAPRTEARPRTVPWVWLSALIALALGVAIGALLGRTVASSGPTPPSTASPAPAAAITVTSTLTKSTDATRVRVVATTSARGGTMVGTLRFVGLTTSRDVPVSRTVPSRSGTGGERDVSVLLYDGSVPFDVHAVDVLSLSSE